MGLVKCPDCLKMVSDKASMCPICGCPASFFDTSNDKTVCEKKEDDYNSNDLGDNKEKNKNYKFVLGFYEIEYPEDYKDFAFLYGKYAKIAKENVDIITKEYNKARDIRTVLYNVIPKGKKILDSVLSDLLGDLLMKGIQITKRDLIRYPFDYADKCLIVEKLYKSSLEQKNQMYREEEYRQASRGRWQGGGFGLKGAVKGAVTASVLNAGSGLIHSFGDRQRLKNIEKSHVSFLQDQKEDERVFQAVCIGLGECIVNAFLKYADYLNNYKLLKVIPLNIQLSNELYDNAKGYEYNNPDKYAEELLKCIMSLPGEEKYYDKVLPLLFEYEKNDILDFLRFWNIDYIYEKYEDEIKIGKIFDDFWEKETGSIKKWADLGETQREQYVKTRKICTVFLKKYGLDDIPIFSFNGSKIHKLYKAFISKTGFMTWYDVIEWIPLNISIEEFFSYLRYEKKSLLGSVLPDSWIKGDDLSEIDELKNKLDFSELMFLFVFTYGTFDRYSGLYITKNGIGRLYKKDYFLTFDVIEYISLYDDMSIEIGSNSKVIHFNFKDSSLSEDQLTYLVKLLRVICVRFGNNTHLWQEKMSTPYPGENAKKEGNIAGVNSKENIEMKPLNKNEFAEYINGFVENEMKKPITEFEDDEMVKKVFCVYCGKKINKNSKFCNFCGKINKYGG